MTLEEMKSRKKELGLSNKELAARSGVPVGTVQRIFSGETKAPRRAAIEGLEKVLGKKTASDQQEFPGSDSIRRWGDRLMEPGYAYGTKVIRELHSEKQQGEYTLEDYYAIPDDKRAELIDGVLYDMSSPSSMHQEISMEISLQLRLFVRQNHGNCSVNAAPYDVQLDQDDRTMVQPDILVLCDREKQRYFGCFGAPDLVVEILSPSSGKKDLIIKLNKYLKAGVRECWMVNPESRQVIVFKNNEQLSFRSYDFMEKIPVGIWDDKCLVDLSVITEKLDFLESLKP